MTTLVEQTARFLSKSNSPYIHEKSLTPDEIEDLMDKGENICYLFLIIFYITN